MTEEEEEEWSVDDLRSPHECEEHWLLRREFLVRNKGKFSKFRLQSLSQVLCNVEFLGCRYPLETMELVANLSEGIVDEYRKKQSNRLQRTMIKASTAAEAKSKGGTTGDRNPTSFNNVVASFLSKDSTVQVRKPQSRNASLMTSVQLPSKSNFPSLRYSFNTTDLNGLVLVEQLFLATDTSAQTIHRSCQMSGKEYTYSYEQTAIGHNVLSTCTFRLGNFSVKGSPATSKDMSKHAAADEALGKLKQICHTIQIKTNVATSTGVSLQELKGEHAALDDKNVGNKLLRLMGWTGGGLGKNEGGIQNPIDVSGLVSIGRSRLGLGSSTGSSSGKPTFTANEIYDFLTKEFQNHASHNKEIVFSSEFTKAERQLIHITAHRLHLKSKSYGKGENRCLVISQKTTLPGLLQEIINEGGETEKYRVVFPQRAVSESRSSSKDPPPATTERDPV